jgi:hypothetical protein
MKKPRIYGMRPRDTRRTYEPIRRIIDADTLRALEKIARASEGRRTAR